MGALKDYIALSRPKHWVKNVFVFMPVPFALSNHARLDVVVFGTGLLAFCLGNSAVYAFNDARDAKRDRLHEKKRHRPVAAGRITEPAAYAWSGLLLAGAFGLMWATGSLAAVLILAAYAALNLAYCLGAKDVPLLDVFILSSGFLLRVLLGCALLGVPASNWLLLCSYSLALFLALAKRRGDVVKGLDGDHRPALSGYNLDFLNHSMGITAGMTVVAYALYLIEAQAMAPGREFVSLPFVVFGVLEYLRLVHVRGAGASPVDLFLSSPTILAVGFGWLASTVWSLDWAG